jgi:hypothetical protein
MKSEVALLCLQEPATASYLEPHESSPHRQKIKVKLFLCLTEHNAIEAYWGSGGIAPLILWPRH